MKTTMQAMNEEKKFILFLKSTMTVKQLLIIGLMMCCFNMQAQKAKQTITISGAQFTSSLVEKWISEYSKVNPDVAISFVKSSKQNKSTDLKLSVNTSDENGFDAIENRIIVGRLAVLPIANEKNRYFAKQLKNGIKQDELKNIFLKRDPNSADDPEEEKAEVPLYTVYTQTTQSTSAKVLVDHFGKKSPEMNGVIVTGDDKFLVESVLGDSTGVTFSNLGLIYDLSNRTPLNGIKILPIDPDNKGHLKKEKLIYNNLDQLITYLETSKNKSIPTESISFNFDPKNKNPLVSDFVNWVNHSGQAYNHQFGFLKTTDEIDRTLTQK